MNAPEAIAELNRRIDALTPDEDHELYRVGFLDDGDESKGASAGAVTRRATGRGPRRGRPAHRRASARAQEEEEESLGREGPPRRLPAARTPLSR